MGQNREQGTIITLVAVFMLFVVGAMAALSIDVVTLYTARSEAQLVADAAALAAARVLANSGATSDSSGTLIASAELSTGPAQQVAIQVAQGSMVGGRALNSGTCPGAEICVSFNNGSGPPYTNPHVTVTVQRADLPTFFARIWGNTQLAVAASATAEAYNPTGGTGASNTTSPPVAPLCVKPWLLPNIDPSTGNAIFDSFGNINDSKLLGWSSTSPPPTPMTLACASGNCSGALPNPAAWNYYPGDPTTTFPPPTTALPTCSQIPTLTPYQASVAGCIQTAISCNNPNANVDASNYGTRNSETANAVNCLAHDTTFGEGDTVISTVPPPQNTPFQFVAGNDNPITGAGTDVMVSDSLVTVPVFDTASFNTSGTNFHIIGFVQLFLNPDSNPADPTTGNVNTTIINMAGCGGTSAGATPILGNGASPVAVRLISPP